MLKNNNKRKTNNQVQLLLQQLATTGKNTAHPALHNLILELYELIIYFKLFLPL